MHPIIVTIAGHPIGTYGVLVAAGLLAGSFYALRIGKRSGIDEVILLDVLFYVTLGVIVGGRLMFCIVNWPIYVESPWRIFKIWEGGLVLYGGFIASVLFGALYCKKNGVDTWRVADALAPGGGLGLFIGRFACLSVGCCWGKVAEGLPWAITFTDPRAIIPFEFRGLPLHPTQLYLSLTGLSICVLATLLHRRKRFHGQVCLSMALFYAAARFLVEFVRGDVDRGFLIDGLLSTSQAVSLPVAALAAVFYLKRSRDPGAAVRRPPARKSV